MSLVNRFKRMKERSLRTTLVVTLMAVTAFSLAMGPSQGHTKNAVAAPSMKLQGLDGRVLDLSELKGSVVLVSFGATWCAPCSTELRALEELLAEYRSRPIKFYWVSIESPDEISNSALKRYAKERSVSFPILRDTAKMVFSQFSPRVRLPMIVLLGKDGRVDAPAQFGMRSPTDAYKADLRARLNRLLASTGDSDR
jgi:cytochrome c biogenesis protein CcmG/thiol:disulfide interchange protein DsbE